METLVQGSQTELLAAVMGDEAALVAKLFREALDAAQEYLVREGYEPLTPQVYPKGPEDYFFGKRARKDDAGFVYYTTYDKTTRHGKLVVTRDGLKDRKVYFTCEFFLCISDELGVEHNTKIAAGIVERLLLDNGDLHEVLEDVDPVLAAMADNVAAWGHKVDERTGEAKDDALLEYYTAEAQYAHHFINDVVALLTTGELYPQVKDTEVHDA